MEEKPALSALVDQMGIQNVTNLITGCDRFARLLAELPWLERERLRIQLNDVIASESTVLPSAAVFMLEAIGKGLEGYDSQRAPYPITPDRDTH